MPHSILKPFKNNITCPQCHLGGLVITGSPRKCDCLFCGFTCWLSQLAGYTKELKNNNNNMITKEIKTRLAYLRQEIEAERISQAEILELQSLAPYIDPSDTLLLQWAGVPEFEN